MLEIAILHIYSD